MNEGRRIKRDTIRECGDTKAFSKMDKAAKDGYDRPPRNIEKGKGKGKKGDKGDGEGKRRKSWEYNNDNGWKRDENWDTND